MQDPRREQLKLSQEDENQIIRQGEVLEGLLKHPGWLMLSSICEAQKLKQVQALVNPSSSRDDDQYRKGVIGGLELLLLTPARVVEHRKEILDSRKEAPGSETEGNS